MEGIGEEDRAPESRRYAGVRERGSDRQHSAFSVGVGPLSLTGLLETLSRAGVRPDSVQVLGGTLSVNRRPYARIDAFNVGHLRDRSLRKARVVRPGHNLKSRLTTDVPGDYQVWWKVRNRGAAAEKAGQLRGTIFTTAA